MVLNATPATNQGDVVWEDRHTRDAINLLTPQTAPITGLTTFKNTATQPAYVFLSPGRHKMMPADGYTLVVYLHGSGETADSAAKVWLSLVNNRSDVEVAVPDYAVTHGAFVDSGGGLPDSINAIIVDTVAGDHINPHHIILAGYSMGAAVGLETLNRYPDLFAGFADISGAQLNASPTLQRIAPRLALYVSVGTGEGLSDADFAFMIAKYKNFGFAHIFSERPNSGHNLPFSVYEPMTEHMLTFFDQVMAANDKLAAATPGTPAPATVSATEPPDGVVVEHRTAAVVAPPRNGGPAMSRRNGEPMPNQRTGGPMMGRDNGANPGVNYVFISPDQTKFPFVQDPTLLICLPGFGDTAVDFAQQWLGLVKSRQDLAVAVTKSSLPNQIAAIITDTVTRDQVNPKHVILLGFDEGGANGAMILGQRPELFAGFAGVSTNLPKAAFTPALQKVKNGLAVYYADGAQDEMVNDVYPPNLAQLKNFGFARLLMEKPKGAHALTPDEITHLMAFFDQALAGNDKKDAAMGVAKK